MGLCIGVCEHVCADTLPCAGVCGGQRSTPGIVLYHAPSYFLKQCLSLNLMLPRLSGAQEICLHLLPQCWSYSNSLQLYT